MKYFLLTFALLSAGVLLMVSTVSALTTFEHSQNDYLTRKGIAWTVVDGGHWQHLNRHARAMEEASPFYDVRQIQNDYLFRKGISWDTKNSRIYQHTSRYAGEALRGRPANDTTQTQNDYTLRKGIKIAK